MSRGPNRRRVAVVHRRRRRRRLHRRPRQKRPLAAAEMSLQPTVRLLLARLLLLEEVDRPLRQRVSPFKILT